MPDLLDRARYESALLDVGQALLDIKKARLMLASTTHAGFFAKEFEGIDDRLNFIINELKGILK